MKKFQVKIIFMENNLMSCKFCEKLFDCQERIPRMIFKCGHSICTSCLKIYINCEKDIFICPEDKKEITIKNKTLDSFPQNYALVNIIQQNEKSEKKIFEENTFKDLNKKSDKEEIQSQSDSLISLNLGDLCIDHKKTLDIICLTCKKTICYQCALFEDHRNHQVKQQNEFLQELVGVKKDICKIKYNIDKNKENLFSFKELLSDLLKKKSEEMDLNIEETFNIFLQKIKNEKQNILEEKKKAFLNFEEILRSKIKTSYDFENDINNWEKRIDELTNNNTNEDMKEAFNIITKVEKENLLSKGKLLGKKIKDIIENCEKNTEEFTKNMEIKETINLNQDLFELFSPEINLESLLLNFNLIESTNFHFSKTDIRRYTENVKKPETPNRFKRKNLSVNENNIKKKGNTIEIVLPQKDISLSKKDISLYESFSFHRQSDIADLKQITVAIKESGLKGEDDLFNELTISDIPELDLNKVDPNELNIMRNNDSRFNSVFNSINYKSHTTNLLKSSSISAIQNNPHFFTKQKNSLSKNIMSVKQSVIEMESPLRPNFSRNRLESRQKENVIKKSKLDTSRSSNKTKKKNKSRPTSSSNKSVKKNKSRPTSSSNKSTRSRKKSVSRTKRSISRKSQNKSKSKSKSKNVRYLKKILDGPKGAYIKKLEKNKITNLDLTFLNLNNNHLEAICPFFTNSRILKVLKLKGNQIGDKGIKALSEVLINSNLSNLDISFNSITKKGVIFLKNLCEQNPKLKNINLKKNKIDQKIRNNLITEFKMMSVNLKI